MMWDFEEELPTIIYVPLW